MQIINTAGKRYTGSLCVLRWYISSLALGHLYRVPGKSTLQAAAAPADVPHLRVGLGCLNEKTPTGLALDPLIRWRTLPGHRLLVRKLLASSAGKRPGLGQLGPGDIGLDLDGLRISGFRLCRFRSWCRCLSRRLRLLVLGRSSRACHLAPPDR